AQGSRVVHVVAKAAVREPLEVRRLDRPAKGAGRAEADIVGQDQENVGCPWGRLDAPWKIGRRILHGTAHLAVESLLRPRQLTRCRHVGPGASGESDG